MMGHSRQYCCHFFFIFSFPFFLFSLNFLFFLFFFSSFTIMFFFLFFYFFFHFFFFFFLLFLSVRCKISDKLICLSPFFFLHSSLPNRLPGRPVHVGQPNGTFQPPPNPPSAPPEQRGSISVEGSGRCFGERLFVGSGRRRRGCAAPCGVV